MITLRNVLMKNKHKNGKTQLRDESTKDLTLRKEPASVIEEISNADKIKKIHYNEKQILQ